MIGLDLLCACTWLGLTDLMTSSIPPSLSQLQFPRSSSPLHHTQQHHLVHHRSPHLLIKSKLETMKSRLIKRFSSYFTEPSGQKYLFYLVCLCYVICTSIIVVIEPFIPTPGCVEDETKKSELEFANSLYVYSKCNSLRQRRLLYFSRVDCLRGRHLLMAVFLGSLIGYERRSSDRPAGIRTMACK